MGFFDDYDDDCVIDFERESSKKELRGLSGSDDNFSNWPTSIIQSAINCLRKQD